MRRLRSWVRRATSSAGRRGRGLDFPPLVCAALASAALLAGAALLASSPLWCIRAVSWTGPLRLAEPRYQALESACLGRPLLLVSERTLRDGLALDPRSVRLSLHRHLPHLLEVRLEPRRAVARLDAVTAVDARGRTLGREHAFEGLPRLVGFEFDSSGKRLEPQARRLLACIRRLVDMPTLAPAEVRLDGDDLELVLADSGARVRLDATRPEPQLEKLRIFEHSLGSEPLPARIDLRFQDQVVVREKGAAHATRRAH